MTEIDIRRLRDWIGRELVSDWIQIDQTQIDQFADATGDHQWIHVDLARAAAESPSKTTIAHGFLALSLVRSVLRQAVGVSGQRMANNLRVNRGRFVSPVPSGAKLRGR